MHQIFNFNNGSKPPGQKDHILVVPEWFLFWDSADISLRAAGNLWRSGQCRDSVVLKDLTLTLPVNVKGDGRHCCICITCKTTGGRSWMRLKWKTQPFAIAGLFSQATSQMKQEAFSLRFTSICSLCGASHSKVLVPITEFQTKPVKREKKKTTLPVISSSEDSWISKNCLLGHSFYCFRALLVQAIYAVFFSLWFATAWSLKAKYTAAGGVCVDAGQQLATSSSWAFHYFKDTVWKSTCGGHHGLQTHRLDFCVRPQVSGEAVSGCFLYHVCSPHSEESLRFHGLFSAGQTHFTIQRRQPLVKLRF